MVLSTIVNTDFELKIGFALRIEIDLKIVLLFYLAIVVGEPTSGFDIELNICIYIEFELKIVPVSWFSVQY